MSGFVQSWNNVETQYVYSTKLMNGLQNMQHCTVVKNSCLNIRKRKQKPLNTIMQKCKQSKH